ncbi:MAG: hypothetical protein ACI8UO_003389 [Verrucomicrobiales bacterium]|jgi:hypothetical protein
MKAANPIAMKNAHTFQHHHPPISGRSLKGIGVLGGLAMIPPLITIFIYPTLLPGASNQLLELIAMIVGVASFAAYFAGSARP